MVRVFESQGQLGAWLAATEYLLQSGNQPGVVLDIVSPGLGEEGLLRARRLIDELYAQEGESPIHTVAEWVFPGWEYSHRGMRGVYENYTRSYAILRKAEPRRWGTYAGRMLVAEGEDGKLINPLRDLIDKMRDAGPRGYKASYELSLYRNTDDAGLWYGGPCLMHLSFKVLGESLDLTALYRSHEYRFKVPGNLLGLARLQSCVARETGLASGRLTVHSTWAWIDPKGGKRKLGRLVAQIREETRIASGPP